MKKLIAVFILLCGCTKTIRAPYPLITQQEMIAEPVNGQAFKMKMADDDPIGSLQKCMKKVHKKNRGNGIGYCTIAAGSLKRGKHNDLMPVGDVQIKVQQ